MNQIDTEMLKKWPTEGFNFLWVCFACFTFHLPPFCFSLSCSCPPTFFSSVWKRVLFPFICSQKRAVHFHSFHSWLWRLYAVYLSRVYKLVLVVFCFVFFFCLPLGSVLVCRRTQTDSEQTDFAFDGEMTATEVCTSRRRCLYLYPWKNKTDIAEKWSDDEP